MSLFTVRVLHATRSARPLRHPEREKSHRRKYSLELQFDKHQVSAGDVRLGSFSTDSTGASAGLCSLCPDSVRSLVGREGYVWPLHHLLQPFGSVAESRLLDPHHRCTCHRPGWCCPNDRNLHRPRASACGVHHQQPLDALADRQINLGSLRSRSRTIELDGEGSHGALVQPKSPILVLFYDRTLVIYSLTPATGAISIHQP